MTGEFAETYTEQGEMNGIRSSSLHQWMNRNGDFDASDYTAPKEILFPSKLLDLTYVKVRFALAERNVRAIHGVFVHRVASVLFYIEQNWELLLNDMEQGMVDSSIPLSKSLREKMREWLPADPDRASELKALDRDTLSEGMIPKIWNEANYILASGSSIFAKYIKQLKKYAGNVPIHYFAYAASEGIMGLASGLNQLDSYILLPESGFFEFIPEDDAVEGWGSRKKLECFGEEMESRIDMDGRESYAHEGGKKDNQTQRPLTIQEVEAGKRYELVLTNHSGLYRYRIADIIQIQGFYYQVPVIRFCYRKNQVLNLVDEKTNVQHLEWAVELFEKKSAMYIEGYCIQEEDTILPGRYLLYLESKGERNIDAERIFDESLCQVNYGYWGCRNMKEIKPLKLKYLKEGAFARYKQYLISRGYEMGQNKPVTVLISEESKLFFKQEME